MNTFEVKTGEHMYVMHFKKGDKLLEGIRSEIERLGIKNAVLVSGLGSLRKFTCHIITKTSDVSADEFINIEGALEVGSIQGMILNGQPHFHIVCSSADGTVYLGHLEDGCEVQYLVEIMLIEVDGTQLTRRKDEFGIDYICEL